MTLDQTLHHRARQSLAAGRLAESEMLFRTLAVLDPADARAHGGRAAIAERRDPGQALSGLTRAALCALGEWGPALANALLALGRADLAMVLARRSLGRRPADRRTWFVLVQAANAAMRPDIGWRAARVLALLDPGHDGFLDLRLHLERAVGGTPFTAAGARHLIHLNPGDPRGWVHGAVQVHQTGGAARALPWYRAAGLVDPGGLEVPANRAAAAIETADIPAAETWLERAASLAPEDGDIIWSRCVLRLSQRRFAEGYAGYDSRWTLCNQAHYGHRLAAPLWQGDTDLKGRLVLWGEQGLGDEILYAGLLGDLVTRGMTLTVLCHPRLVSLFARSFPAVTFLPRTDAPPPLGPDVAAQSSLLRLPKFLRRSPGDFPAHGGYLRPCPEETARQKDLLAALGPAPRLGLCWRSGNARTGAGKSAELLDFLALLRRDDLTLVDLQYGDTTAERAALAGTGGRLHANPLAAPGQDIDQLAAQIAALDGVVSIASVTAHLAGALGRPGHILVPPAPVWFWFNAGADCPWYPSLTLHRPKPGETWPDVIRRLGI